MSSISVGYLRACHKPNDQAEGHLVFCNVPLQRLPTSPNPMCNGRFTDLISHRCVSLFCAGRVTRAKSFSSISCASINRPLLFCWMVNMLLPKAVTIHLWESLFFPVRVTSAKSCPEL